MNIPAEAFLMFPVFLLSLTVHEFSHALTAYWGGDRTAAYQGRLTLNPIAHIDPIGTIILPLLAIFSNVPFLFGWAKPVPVQEENFRRPGWGMIVAIAGPASNFLLVLLTVLLLKIWKIIVPGHLPDAAATIIGYMIIINIVLMVFNMIPIPPLDGSHVLWHLVIKNHEEWYQYFFMASRFGILILMLLFMFPMTRALFHSLIGFFIGLTGWIIGF